MTRIYFIRHGQTTWNHESKYQGHSDISLSELGVAQAQKLSSYFKSRKLPLDLIFSSDLSRAYQTAQELAKAYDLEVKLNDSFREMNFGVWEGLTFKEIQKQYSDLAHKWIIEPEALEIPNGESFFKVKLRAEKALLEIITSYKDKNIAVVSHGGTLRTIFCSLLDIPLTKMWQFKLDNTALSIFEFIKGKPILTLYNSTAHLD